MSSTRHLKQQAERARRLALNVLDPALRTSFLTYPDECDAEAARIETGAIDPADRPIPEA